MDPDDDRTVERIRSAAHTAPAPPHHADLLDRAERLRTRRRRTTVAASGAGVVAVAGVVALVAVLANGPGRGSGVDAADQGTTPTRPTPTVGCGGMTVASASTTADDLVLTLRNGGTSGCDVRGLEVVTEVGPRSLRDRATAADLRPGDPLAAGSLAPGGEVLVLAATDTCQSSGVPVEVVLGDGTTLDLTFPGTGQPMCNEPGFDLEITAVGTTGTGDDLVVGVNPAVDFRPAEQTRGSARWDPGRGTVSYASPTVYDGCLARGRATLSGSTVELALSPPGVGSSGGDGPDVRRCTSIGLAVVATVYGLREAPTALAVTEDGRTTAVPVEQDPGAPADGDPATWRLSERPEVGPTTTSLDVGVTRIDCNGGVTGAVLVPDVDYQETQVVVTFEVDPADAGGADCQGNPAEPYELVLSEPVGERTLVDGACLPGAGHEGTSFCQQDGVRYRPS